MQEDSLVVVMQAGGGVHHMSVYRCMTVMWCCLLLFCKRRILNIGNVRGFLCVAV